MKNVRLGFFAKFVLSVLGVSVSLGIAGGAWGQAAGTKFVMYVGTYTNKTESKGIYAWRFDASTGRLADGSLVAQTKDPSFVAIAPSGKYLYAVNELDEFNGEKAGAVSSFAIDLKTTKLKFLNQVSSRGGGPCYVS